MREPQGDARFLASWEDIIVPPPRTAVDGNLVRPRKRTAAKAMSVEPDKAVLVFCRILGKEDDGKEAERKQTDLVARSTLTRDNLGSPNDRPGGGDR